MLKGSTIGETALVHLYDVPLAEYGLIRYAGHGPMEGLSQRLD